MLYPNGDARQVGEDCSQQSRLLQVVLNDQDVHQSLLPLRASIKSWLPTRLAWTDPARQARPAFTQAPAEALLFQHTSPASIRYRLSRLLGNETGMLDHLPLRVTLLARSTAL